MPPPSIIPPRSNYPPPEIAAPEPPLPARVNIASRPNRKQPFGFKPISRAQPTSSSALRRFFPGDDDDVEQPPTTEPPPSPLQQRQGFRPSHQTPIAKGVWPPPEQQEELPPQTPPWPVREPIDYTRGESSYNEQPPIKQSAQPQPSYDTVWNRDATSHQAFVPADPVLNGKPHNLPYQRNTEPVVEPSQPSPTPRHIPPSPSLLPAPPPPPPPHQPPLATSKVDDQPTSQGPSKTSQTPEKPVYNIVTQVGEGTFGKVYKARNSVSNLLVALKRIRMETEKDGFPVTAMREIKLLQSLRHENIVQLYEMIVSNGKLILVSSSSSESLTFT